MEKGNVLIIGNSGVGKSTLINAVLGEDRAETGWGKEGTTRELKLYETEGVPFRLIDTVGFEPTFLKERMAVGAVKKWSKDCADQGLEDNQVNVIWFCVDGTAGKLFPKTIQSLAQATSMWKSVPIVVVVTKSYSVPDRERNIALVKEVFAEDKRLRKRLRDVIPVVAQTYTLNDTAFAPPEGIAELIERTYDLMPEGLMCGQSDLNDIILSRKRALSQGFVVTAAAGGAAVGAIPIPYADAALLVPVESALVKGIAKIYGIADDDKNKDFIEAIIQAGTVGMVAKEVISTLKAVPGINLSASVLNAIIAAAIVALVGEGSCVAFEKVYLGEESIADVEWLSDFMENYVTDSFLGNIEGAMKELSNKATAKEIGSAVMGAITRS